jgi:hypothetical protein
MFTQEMLEKHLSIQLNLSWLEGDDGCVPRAGPREGQDLLVAHCELVKSLTPDGSKERLARQVLLLCHTLWGELPSIAADATPAIVSNARRKAVCDWLKSVIREEEQANPINAVTPEQKVVRNLAQGNLLECVNECQENGDHYLSLIVASSGSSSATKGFFQEQVC